MERHSDDFGDLHCFALERLHAADYPKSSHPYAAFRCRVCGSEVWEVVLDHHTGSEWTDFKGIVLGRCVACHDLVELLSFTGPHRRSERAEAMVCPCGSTKFSTAMCERYEGEDGIPGFFDEGVIVGKCADCLRNVVVALTD